MTRLAIALAVVACALSIVTLATRSQPSTGANVTQAAEQYIQDIAQQNSLRIDKETVQAVRVTGDEAIVRVTVKYTPWFQPGPGAPKLYGPQSTVTLAVHLHRSQWNAGYANS